MRHDTPSPPPTSASCFLLPPTPPPIGGSGWMRKGSPSLPAGSRDGRRRAGPGGAAVCHRQHHHRHVTARGSRHGDGAGHQDQAGQQGLPLRGECGRARARGGWGCWAGRASRPTAPTAPPRPLLPPGAVAAGPRPGSRRVFGVKGWLLSFSFPLASVAVPREYRRPVSGEGGRASGGSEGGRPPETWWFGVHL